MGDPSLRKSSALKRLRSQLKKKQESLADHFDFKMYITFHFKEKVYCLLKTEKIYSMLNLCWDFV